MVGSKGALNLVIQQIQQNVFECRVGIFVIKLLVQFAARFGGDLRAQRRILQQRFERASPRRGGIAA
jgi:hypothetical protein